MTFAILGSVQRLLAFGTFGLFSTALTSPCVLPYFGSANDSLFLLIGITSRRTIPAKTSLTLNPLAIESLKFFSISNDPLSFFANYMIWWFSTFTLWGKFCSIHFVLKIIIPILYAHSYSFIRFMRIYGQILVFWHFSKRHFFCPGIFTHTHFPQFDYDHRFWVWVILAIFRHESTDMWYLALHHSLQPVRRIVSAACFCCIRPEAVPSFESGQVTVRGISIPFMMLGQLYICASSSWIAGFLFTTPITNNLKSLQRSILSTDLLLRWKAQKCTNFCTMHDTFVTGPQTKNSSRSWFSVVSRGSSKRFASGATTMHRKGWETLS